MMSNLLLKRCPKCNALVRVMSDCQCQCGFECCGEKMVDVLENATDAAFEKHIPNFEREDGKLVVTVNHVMEDEHYIEWIMLMSDDREETVHLAPQREAKVTFKDVEHGTLYAYCNKHGLWKREF